MPQVMTASELFERGEQAVSRLGDTRRRLRSLADMRHHTPPDRTERLAELSSQIVELQAQLSADEAALAEMERLIAQVGEKNDKWGRVLRLRHRKGLNIKGISRMICTSDRNASGLLKRATAYADGILAERHPKT